MVEVSDIVILHGTELEGADIEIFRTTTSTWRSMIQLCGPRLILNFLHADHVVHGQQLHVYNNLLKKKIYTEYSMIPLDSSLSRTA